MRHNCLNYRDQLDWKRRWSISLDIARGLNYLHSRNIIHQDLKSLNILLDSNFRAKISDFGLAKIKTATATTNNNSSITGGSTRWRAPETFKLGAKRTFSSDVFSFGMTLWEISARKVPYSTEPDDTAVIFYIRQGDKEPIPEDCPRQISQVIESCWQMKPEDRPSMKDVVSSLEKAVEDVKGVNENEMITTDEVAL